MEKLKAIYNLLLALCILAVVVIVVFLKFTVDQDPDNFTIFMIVAGIYGMVLAKD